MRSDWRFPAIVRASRGHWISMAPLLGVAAVLALYALSPRITFGSHVLTDYSTPWLERIALRPGVTLRRELAHDPGATRWTYPFRSADWPDILAPYRHLLLILPPQCGASPVSFEAAGYLASQHGLSVNAGEQSRWDDGTNQRYCADLGDAIAQGRYADDTVYLVRAAHVP